MFQRKFSFLTFLICMLLSVSCGTDPNTLSEPTVAPTEPPLIIGTDEATEEPTPSEDVTEEPTPEATEEVTEKLEPTPVSTEVAAQEEAPASTDASSENSIRVGSKEYTEQLLLGKMLILRLQDAGYDVVDKTGFDQSLIRQALEDGEIDLHWELTGTALTKYHNVPARLSHPDLALVTIRDLDQPKGLVWFDIADFNNTYTLMVLPNRVEEGMTTISDLANFMNANDSPLNVCVEDQFLVRPDGLFPLQNEYEFKFKEEKIKVVQYDQLYEALRRGECDVAEGYATDARITAWDLRNLVDDQTFFPAYNVAPVVRQSALDQHPNLKELLDNFMFEVGPRLDDNMMGLLNACVDLGPDGEFDTGDEKSVEEVARAFLEERELDCLPDQIIVSSHDAPEAKWVGKALFLLLSEAGYDVVDKTGLGPPNVLRQAIDEGKIDLYWDVVSFALMLKHGLPPEAIPETPEKAIALVQNLDQPRGIAWVKPDELPSTVTNILLVSNETYEEGIQSIEELADFMNANDSPLKVCVDSSFAERPDGLSGVEAFYGFKFKAEHITINQPSKIFPNLQNGSCQVAQGTSIDNLEPWGFQVLTDNQKFFPPLIELPVVRQAVLDEFPALTELLKEFRSYVTNEKVNELNRLLAVGPDGELNSGDEESVETLARLLLCENGAISDCPITAEVTPDPASDPTPEVGATATPEQGQCQNIVLNGDFELDENWGRPATSLPAVYSTDKHHSGERAMRLGAINESEDRFSQSVAKQLIAIPSDTITATLSYWYHPISFDSNGGDVQGAVIFHPDESFVRRTLQRELSNERAWSFQSHDLSAFIGEEALLYFYVQNDGDGQQSGMYVDEVSVQVCSDSQ